MSSVVLVHLLTRDFIQESGTVTTNVTNLGGITCPDTKERVSLCSNSRYGDQC